MTSIPRVNFAHLPTPIEALPRLEAVLAGPRLLVKRDDQTGLAFGGNKTRKLEFLIAEAQQQEARTLVTTGAAQSNHCRQTAAAAARFGFECTLVLTGDQPPAASGNLFLDHLFGARVVWAGSRDQQERVLAETFAQVRASGKKPYLVPYGGSNPTGALAYAFAMQEYLEQGRSADWILFASSSGGTQAGLILGALHFGYRGKLLGISVDEPQAALQQRVAQLVNDTAPRLGEQSTVQPEHVLVNADYCSAGYGVLTGNERQAISLFARYEGLLLDPVYTGRAAGALLDLIRRGFFKTNETILFWHTGGQPALFADKYEALLSK